MNQKHKILYISQEITPYLRETPMSLLGKNLPQKVQEKGYEARAFMPKYGCINERRNQLHEVIRLSGINLSVDNTDHPLIIKVATLQSARMQVYFIDTDDFFQHHAVTDLEIRETPEENDERTMFFTRGVMETVKKLRWEPAITHCSGWITALAPLYLKKAYADDPTIGGSPVVYALFDESFEDTFDPRFKEKLLMDGFTEEDLKTLGDGPVDFVTLNKLAIDYADGVMQASENIPQELIDYAKAQGKPFLPYQGEDFDVTPVVEFYDSLRTNS
jgi:starch synthase